MRALAVFLCVVALTGCQDRRSFDERYADTERNIEQRAQTLDADLNKDEASPANQEQQQQQR